MTEKVTPHPVAAAARERSVANSAEGQVLLNAIADALQAYSDFLQNHDLIWDEESDQQKVLVATIDYNDINQPIEVYLKGGALDRSNDSHYCAAPVYRTTRGWDAEEE